MPTFTPKQIDARIEADPEMQALAQSDPTEFLAQHETIYKEFGYKPDGSPLSTAAKVFQKTSKLTGIPEGMVQTAASLPLPIAGTIAGGLVGAGGGLGGAVIGASGGSVLGEAGNALLGITEPLDNVDLGVAAGAPLIGPVAGKVLKGLGTASRALPGVGSGLHQMAGENLELALKKLKVTSADVDMFSDLLKKVPEFKVQTPLMKQAVKDELDRASASIVPDEAYIKSLNKLTKTLHDDPHVSFKSLMSTEHDLNELKHAQPTALWKKLSGILIDDLDAQAKNPALTQATRDKIAEGSQAYKNVVKVAKRMHANDSLDSVFKNVVAPVAGDDTLVRFNKAKFVKELRDNEVLKSNFSSAELDSIKTAVDDIGYLGFPPATGQSGMGFIGRSGAAGAVGYAMLGGSTGAMAGFAIAETLRQAMTTQTGRNFVKSLAKKGGGKLDMLELKTTMGKIISGMSAGVAGVSGKGSPVEGINAFENEP